VTAPRGLEQCQALQEDPMMTRTFLSGLIATIVASTALAADAPLPVVTQDAFLESLKADAKALFVLDVRTPDEYAGGYVPDAVNIPHDQLASRLAEVPKDREVVIYCRSGRRAEIAGQVLATHGYTKLEHLQGDMQGWQAAQRPVDVPRDPAACATALKAGELKPESCQPR
jgi:rhodanese-related sulfurtransferase